MDDNLMNGRNEADASNVRVFPPPPHDANRDDLAQMADALLDQVGAVRGHYEQLESLLDEATVPEGSPGQTVAAPAAETALDESVDPLRLIAKDMAFGGASREQTEDYLRNSFGVDESDAIVDEVFEEMQPEPPPKRRLGRLRR